MEKERKPGFTITSGRGFHITFDNLITVSVQFGAGNYCQHHDSDFSRVIERLHHSPDAEIAIFDAAGNWLTKDFWLEQFGQEVDDDVAGWQSPETVLKALIWAEKRAKAMPQEKELKLPREAWCSEEEIKSIRPSKMTMEQWDKLYQNTNYLWSALFTSLDSYTLEMKMSDQPIGSYYHFSPVSCETSMFKSTEILTVNRETGKYCWRLPCSEGTLP